MAQYEHCKQLTARTRKTWELQLKLLLLENTVRSASEPEHSSPPCQLSLLAMSEKSTLASVSMRDSSSDQNRKRSHSSSKGGVPVLGVFLGRKWLNCPLLQCLPGFQTGRLRDHQVPTVPEGQRTYISLQARPRQNRCHRHRQCICRHQEKKKSSQPPLWHCWHQRR